MIRWTHPGGARRAALATALVAATLAVPGHRAAARSGRPRRDLPHQAGGRQQLQGDGDAELPDRRARAASHELAADAPGGRVGAEAADVVGPRQRPHREVGTVRARLGQRAHVDPHGCAAAVRHARLSQGVDAGHDRRSERRRRRRDHRERRGLCQVQGDAEGQVRPAVAEPRRRRLLRVADAALHRRWSRRPVARADRRRSRPLPRWRRFRRRHGAAQEAHGLLQGRRRAGRRRDVGRRSR